MINSSHKIGIAHSCSLVPSQQPRVSLQRKRERHWNGGTSEEQWVNPSSTFLGGRSLKENNSRPPSLWRRFCLRAIFLLLLASKVEQKPLQTRFGSSSRVLEGKISVNSYWASTNVALNFHLRKGYDQHNVLRRVGTTRLTKNQESKNEWKVSEKFPEMFHTHSKAPTFFTPRPRGRIIMNRRIVKKSLKEISFLSPLSSQKSEPFSSSSTRPHSHTFVPRFLPNMVHLWEEGKRTLTKTRAFRVVPSTFYLP